jgi:hypothetical protein
MTALITVFVPERFRGTVFESVVNSPNTLGVGSGLKETARHYQREHNGRTVVDITYAAFLGQLHGANGLEWMTANPEVLAWMGQSDRREMYGNFFPGEHRPPPVKAEPVPVVMVKLVAPANMSACSIEGEELKIGKDGIVTVTDKVADMLRSHGFRDAA